MIKLETEARGFMALVTVIIIAATALVMSLNSSLLGLGTLEFGTLVAGGGEAASLADACVEEALQRLRVNQSYSGDPALSIFGGTCIITVTDLGGGERQATVIATQGDFTKRVEVNMTLGVRTVTVSHWQEL
ncbi:MAG: hypothetical protein HYT46_02545 [Candidatus Vogelbacteria bacterium]|nr:hypothetical protein [Candidatus Vogelbacteria bacterium]